MNTFDILISIVLTLLLIVIPMTYYLFVGKNLGSCKTKELKLQKTKDLVAAITEVDKKASVQSIYNYSNMSPANWHPVEYDGEGCFTGELPETNKNGESLVLITEEYGHFKSDYTDEYVPEDEDEFVVDGYRVETATFREGYFVGATSSHVKAWDYSPEPFVP